MRKLFSKLKSWGCQIIPPTAQKSANLLHKTATMVEHGAESLENKSKTLARTHIKSPEKLERISVATEQSKSSQGSSSPTPPPPDASSTIGSTMKKAAEDLNESLSDIARDKWESVKEDVRTVKGAAQMVGEATTQQSLNAMSNLKDKSQVLKEAVKDESQKEVDVVKEKVKLAANAVNEGVKMVKEEVWAADEPNKTEKEKQFERVVDTAKEASKKSAKIREYPSHIQKVEHDLGYPGIQEGERLSREGKFHMSQRQQPQEKEEKEQKQKQYASKK